MSKSTGKGTSINEPTKPLQPKAESNASLTKEKQAEILLVEYDRLSAEVRMFVEQYSPKFTVFAVFVLAAFAFAFQNPAYQIIYVAIPLFVFLIGYTSVAQGHIISILVGRIRAIEEKITLLNGGEPILEWETKIASKLFLPALIRIRLIGRKRRWIIPNPILLSVVFIILTVLPMIIYSTWKAYSFIPSPWNKAYASLVIVSFVGIAIQSFSYFFFGSIMDRIDFDNE